MHCKTFFPSLFSQQIRQTVLTRVGTRSHSHSTVSQSSNKTEEEDEEDSITSEVRTIYDYRTVVRVSLGMDVNGVFVLPGHRPDRSGFEEQRHERGSVTEPETASREYVQESAAR